MENREIKLLQNYVKKRFDDCEMDYNLFDVDLDTDLSYEEQKNIFIKRCDEMLPLTNVQKLKQEQEQQMLKQQEEIKVRLDKEIEKITKDSKELERLYYTPIKYIEMVANGSARGLLLYGESSLGKSYRVKEVLKRLGKENFMFISGHITPYKFYQKLYEAKDNLVIFDDVDILGNKIIINMIKASLNENSGNVVEYHTSKKMDIPNSFIFNGQVIMLLNDIPNRNEHLKAIESRVLKYHLQFNREEIIKIIFEIAHKHEIEGITTAEKIMIANWIKENTSQATRNLNIRLFLQTIDFYKWNKESWEELARGQIEDDSYALLVLQGISDDDWVEQTNLSLKTKQRVRAKLGLTRGYRTLK